MHCIVMLQYLLSWRASIVKLYHAGSNAEIYSNDSARGLETRAGNLCTREYSWLFVALFSLQATRELYTVYTHNTWVVWSKTSKKTKKAKKRLIASTQVPSSSSFMHFYKQHLR